MYHFPNVSLVITHYKRSRSLERQLESFKRLNCTFGEVIVSDDGSPQEHLDYIKMLQEKFGFRLLTTPENKGLGVNNNRSQDAVTKPLTLYVQEDFDPFDTFPEAFVKAVAIMEREPQWDMVRFYAYKRYPYLKYYDGEFYEQVFKPNMIHYKHIKFYFYSDHPHLRRSDFFKKFGRYVEGYPGDRTEYLMSLSFIVNKAKSLYHTNFSGIFNQVNTTDEPSVIIRDTNRWRDRRDPLARVLRQAHLKVKLWKWTKELKQLRKGLTISPPDTTKE
ncbi:glycosyltransferase family 2 protein [Niabella soli]|uniref:Glycosyl transferase family 2 n=1 Tax=Niabella soli DSM 19437 TaxID=929713 RepID=W0EY98_9BACT|nr:glycosyltransferase [Niabella soli]AHF14159.1 glycosyl transferase family 2 [Niabella soli DSM 19437]